MAEVEKEESAVKIAVRECPFGKDDETIIEYNNVIENILIASQRPFAFDFVFKANSIQIEVFESLARPLIEKTIKGYNCNIFAYGQTGTGKTYTMGLTQNLRDDCAGIIPRCLKTVFSSDCISDGKISVSYIEIYNERVYDMLSTNPGDQVNIKGCKFNGGQKKQVETSEEGFNCLLQGNKNRHVRPTKMNAQSSRSHAIFTIHVERKSENTSSISMLNLVDLAGSEGVRRTGHEGVALSEGVNINQGLLSVGKVVQALNTRNKVIPYRDSILTSVLQDSLNLNSYLTLLACVSSKKIDKSETMSTLRFAQNAKSLRNNPLINSVFLEYQNPKNKTPSKIKVTPLKTKNVYTPYMQHRNFSTSTAKKINPFCSTSSIRKIGTNRLNSTEIRKPQKNLVHPSAHSEVSIDSTSTSMASFLNASSSTTILLPDLSHSDQTNEIGLALDKQLDNLMEPVVARNQTIVAASQMLSSQVMDGSKSFWNEMRADLRNIIREELLRLTSNNKTKARSKLFDESRNEDIRKENRTPSPNSSHHVSSTEENQKKSNESAIDLNENFDVDGEHSNSSSNRTNVSRKRKEIFEITVETIDENTELEANKAKASKNSFSFITPYSRHGVEKENQTINSSILPRRSQRLSRCSTIRNCSFERKNLRRSSRLESKEKVNQPTLRSNSKCNESKSSTTKRIKTDKIITEKPRKQCITRNSVISSYFASNQANTNTKGSKAKHQKAILDLLNNGTIKELQILPQIGLKTAYQIISHRTLKGKFKDFDAVSKIPVWRGKAWERFKESNFL